MSQPNPAPDDSNSTSSQSGGVKIDSGEQTKIGGDVVGRDKITTIIVPGDVVGRDSTTTINIFGGKFPIVYLVVIGVAIAVSLIVMGLSIRQQIGSTTTPTPTPTLTPTPEPRAELLRLIETERQAVLTRNLNLLKDIFTGQATRTNGATNVSAPVMSEYASTFANEVFQEITHTNFQFDIDGHTATVTNDSCGLIHLKNENRDLPFDCPQCDRWTFQRDTDGRWWITDFTYGLGMRAARHTSSFEDDTNGCWAARIDGGVPQGSDPVFTEERAAQGQGALRLPLNLNANVPRSQIVRRSMPFAGRATAQVYAPPDAPADLVAGFFAMEFDHEPWNYHPAEQLVQLKPGAWTTVNWIIAPRGWAQPLHLLGLEVRRANNEPYNGYVIVDEVVIDSQ